MSGKHQGPANGASWHGLPLKQRGETFGEYRDRITTEQEIALVKAARLIGVQPRSIFESYIPNVPEAELPPPADKR